MIALTLKPASGRTNIADVTHGAGALHASTKVGDFATLQSLSFKLRVRIEQVNGLHYIGRMVDCPVEEYEGEEIEFDERHILHRESPLTS
jgi:hypothetical protein